MFIILHSPCFHEIKATVMAKTRLPETMIPNAPTTPPTTAAILMLDLLSKETKRSVCVCVCVCACVCVCVCVCVRACVRAYVRTVMIVGMYIYYINQSFIGNLPDTGRGWIIMKLTSGQLSTNQLHDILHVFK